MQLADLSVAGTPMRTPSATPWQSVTKHASGPACLRKAIKADSSPRGTVGNQPLTHPLILLRICGARSPSASPVDTTAHVALLSSLTCWW